MDRAPALPIVKKRSNRFRQGAFNLNDQLRSWWTYSVDEDTLLVIVEYKSKIATEAIATGLKIDISTVFRHLKKLMSKKNCLLWQV